MTISLPSKEIYSFDVPEVKSFLSEFKYNFFVPDERTSDTGGIPKSYAEKTSVELGVIAENSTMYDFISLKVPRWNKLSWRLPNIKFPGSSQREDETIRAAFPVQPDKNFISSNISKIVYEDRTTTDTFVAVNFQDPDIDNRIYNLVSGSYEMATTLDDSLVIDNPVQKALYVENATPPGVNPEFMTSAMAQPLHSSGVTYDSNTVKHSQNDYIKKLQRVNINAQINIKSISSLVNVATRKSFTPTSDSFNELNTSSEIYKQLAKLSIKISDADYKTFLPYVDVVTQKRNATRSPIEQARLVGYIINKIEILPDGSSKQHPDIIVESPRVASTLDFKVKYGAVYYYAIRVVYLLPLVAFDADTGNQALIRILIASRPSQKEFVACEEQKSPPPPADFNLRWDYDRPNARGRLGSLMLHWTFPPNVQRDIKKFHVMRRQSLNHPFEILRVYDFDDSTLLTPNQEQYDVTTTVRDLSPQLCFYDDEFGKENKYIYAVSAQDAHGYISNYSVQFEVTFDKFKNTLVKKHISPSGAPRPYPNLFVEADLFIDTIRVSGERSKKLTICFDPEYYTIENAAGHVVSRLETKQTGGKYRLQFINTDNQKSDWVDFIIDDPLHLVEKSKQS